MVSWFHGENNPPGPHYGLRMEHAAKWPRHGDETGSGSMKRPETIRIGVFVHLRSSGFRGGVEFGRWPPRPVPPAMSDIDVRRLWRVGQTMD